ncbi:MAG: DUF3426 domain-containing protein [Moraxella sp.]|uniref:DUF3426 domain-containing protein n=1 Tax=Moraxella sp. TaxID=479 RepID=UPI0026DD4F98|nr:DUF3426 domain-containing protein [Moraxella sp.]MDO4449477.1 DUF3426 domain-containing protein [Moraxella sp.]
MSSQTQCPNCNTTYPMPVAKMGDPNARAKCGRCQQVFFLNANIITPTNTAQTSSQPQQPQDDLPASGVSRRKRTKPTPTEGMIHDEMDGTNNAPTDVSSVAFSDDELDNFLNEAISVAPKIAKSTKDEMADNEDEAWIKNLLDDSKPVNTSQTVNTATSPVINNVDLSAVIPVAAPKAKKPISIKQVTSDTPTAQQIATKKPLGTQLLWLFGCVILVVLLGVQYVLFNVDKIARNPETSGLAHLLCDMTPCQIPSADLNSLHIESTLQNGKDVIIYINNKSNTEQLFPYLLVQLKDDNGAVVADFVADTKDYLSESQTTILANQRKRIMLSAKTTANAKSVTVKPFYQQP